VAEVVMADANGLRVASANMRSLQARRWSRRARAATDSAGPAGPRLAFASDPTAHAVGYSLAAAPQLQEDTPRPLSLGGATHG